MKMQVPSGVCQRVDRWTVGSGRNISYAIFTRSTQHLESLNFFSAKQNLDHIFFGFFKDRMKLVKILV